MDRARLPDYRRAGAWPLLRINDEPGVPAANKIYLTNNGVHFTALLPLP